ncbi:Mechanosensitive ion channel-domain-containing protein [Leptodontidium sp. 2 PMI_412]|nr:Mechanosensitive ion channel-domain-containing protein [Leptodontidium sp. MPI-SDFR-AT-0119]KAH9223357.1 Mechanosensitive ion channel-domain-containing protein [Leptodontidium sp. 2 PMI_412]
MSLRSPRSPTDFSRRGFQPLPTANNPNMGNSYDTEGGIPLTNVQTRASSTGARKPGEGVMNDGDLSNQPTSTDEEKKGLFHRGGRRKAKKIDSKPVRRGTDGEEISITGLGKLYNKIVTFSVVTRYLMYVAPIASLIAIPIVIYAATDRNARFVGTGVKVWLFWLWIEIIWLSIWVSKLVSKAVPGIFMFLCGVVSSGTRKYATILRAVEIPLSLVGWSVTSLVTFTALTSSHLNPGPQKGWIDVMKKLLAPALIASIIFLVEKMLVQLISINYHKRSFDGRIKDSKRNIHLLGLLYDASRTLFPVYCPEFIEEDYIINDSIEALLAKATGQKPSHARSGSATPMRIIGNIGRVGDKVTSVFGNIASEITGKQVFNPTSSHTIIIEALEKTKSSEALARRLWMSFVVEGKEALYAEDIEEVLGPGRKEEADEIFGALDNDGNGDISLEEMIMKVVEIGRDRKAINASMRDVGQAIGVLDSVLVTILCVIVLFIFVAFQNTSFVTTLATAGTTLLSLSFVFAATTQEFLGSCIFLFVKHPYDVGDRVDIDKVYLVVEQISLLYTVFKRIDTMKMVQVPNIVLNNLWIENVTRSKAMKEQLEMFISFDTTLEDIELLRAEMEAFVRASDNSRDFQPDIILEATGIGNMDKLQLKVEIRHKSNWANETVRAARRSKFMCALVLALRKIPIYAPGGGGEALGGPTNPGYSVAISDEWAAEAREKAKTAKEEKRFIPTPKKDNTASSSGVDHLGSNTEEGAADSLNRRKPTEDPSAGWVATRDDEEDGHMDALERKRSNEIDNLKSALLKRASTRGRRRPGDHLPPSPGLYNTPSLNVTAASPRNTAGFGVRDVVDEEAELETGYAGAGYGQSQGGAYGGQGQNQQGGMGYAMFPTSSPPQTQQQRPGQQVAPPPNASSQQQGRSRRLSLGFKGPESSS